MTGRASVPLAANGTASVTITLASAGTIQGTVYKPDATTPVAGVTVSIPGVGQTTTAANGTYSLSNIIVGTYAMQVLDSVNNQLGGANSITVATQGQVVTSNFVIIGRGTITGQVTDSNGTPAPGVPVSVQSLSPGDSQPYGTATDVNGKYTISVVPVGAYNAIAQTHTATSNSYGQASGSLPSDGVTSITNIQLSTSLVPTTLQLADANGAQYPIRENGGLFDGSYSVFAGDSGSNEGGSLLTLTQGGVAFKFTGSTFGSLSLSGRQLSITQTGIAGLNVTRRIYVPSDGYFARYVELISNPGTQNVTVDLTGFGSVTVHVLDAGANPISGASVSLVTNAYNKTYTATSTAQFPVVFQGFFNVNARNPAYGSSSVAYNGHQNITVTLQALANISGTVYGPDGVTPQAGTRVQLFPPYGNSTTTAANGTYQFPNLTLSYYSMAAYDTNGQLRASASSVPLQTAGQTVTQNFTFVGVGSVSGIVFNTDGSRAINTPLTIASQNSSFGGNRTVTTGGDGSYSAGGIPVGKFTVTVNGLASTLAGFGSGTIAADGSTVVLHIHIISSTVLLPLTLNDADGYAYAIQGDGRYGLASQPGAINSPFYSAQSLVINAGSGGFGFGGSGTAPTTSIQSLGGQQIEINSPSVAGLNVTR